MKKSILAVLLIVILVLSNISCGSQDTVTKSDKETSESVSEDTKKEETSKETESKETETEKTTESASESSDEPEELVIPEKYDPRPDSVPPVRQQYWGTCWDFGGIATVEISLIKQGLADNTVDLSEEDVLWFGMGGDLGYWNKPSRNDGAFAAIITGYLQTVGVRSEEDIPYLGKPEDPDSEVEYYLASMDMKPEKYNTAPVQYEITDMRFLKEISMEEAKRTILTKGAFTASYREDPINFNEEYAAVFDVKRNGEEANHVISVVGWDDNYPKERFLEIEGRKPEKDGAWLIRNSRGTEYGGDGGYTWISYEDEYHFVTEDYNYLYNIEGIRKPLNYKRYLHDEMGASWDWSPECDGQATFAAVYDFGEGEKMQEISFVTWSDGAKYELFYAPVDAVGVPTPEESEWTPLKSGVIDYTGYRTMKLDTPFDVPRGTGAILLRITGEEPNIGTDENRTMENNRPLFTTKIAEGSCFILDQGTFIPTKVEKTNILGEKNSEAVDICLRAYTSK